MSTMTIHDLLPIPQGAKQPNAYQVFGLEIGEDDAATIKSAMTKTVQRLKKAKPKVDPQVWNEAAKLVQQAKKVLSDPDQKSELDARFGIVKIASPPTDPTPGAASGSSPTQGFDPLAGVLPAGDPLAAVLPPTGSVPVADAVPVPPVAVPPAETVSVTPNQPAAPAFQTPPATPPQSPFPPTSAPFGVETPQPASDQGDSVVPMVVAKPEKKTSGPAHRRRRSVLSSLAFAVFVLTMLVVIGGLGYFLFFGPGQLAIRKSNDSFTISTGPPETEPAPRAVNPSPTTPEKPRPVPQAYDEVMGRLAGDMPPPSRIGSLTGEIDGAPTMGGNPAADPSDQEGMDGGAGPESMTPGMDPPAQKPATDPPMTEPSPQDPPAKPAPEEMTEEMIATADEKIRELAELIKSANWKEMKPAADKLIEAPLTKSQQAMADALYEVADLASYYRGGIERGVGTLVVGNDFAVTDAFRVIVVETGEDLLVVRYNAKNRSYTFDEFPFTLAHKLAAFSMPADAPTTTAAKAVYQAIAPKTTESHREESFSWLESITEEVEGADPKRVAETLKTLLGNES